MRSIVLSGFMGTGKSTVGPALASVLGLPFVDTDSEIERASGKPVPDIWREEGEAAFREREASLIDRLLLDDAPKVIAFGGGAVTTPRVRRLATERALVVTLTASPGTVVARTPNVALRPNLATGGDPVDRARELLSQRADSYAECHLSLSTEGIDADDVVDAVVGLVRRDPLLVPLGARSYCIDVCNGEPMRLTDAIARCAPSAIVLVTDSNVQRARGAAVEAALHPLTLAVTRVTLPHGEVHKVLSSVSTIWDAALGAGIDREALVVAVGGGVVGDLAGFAAASLLRGVRVLQVPTTLLAMVDSSVGGKTGFDHPAGKNLLGAFHQPSAVVADLAHLTTLSARQRAAGLAEVAKIALATDAGLLERVERDAASLARGEVGSLLPVLRAAIAAKIRVVRDDEREAGLRALLNLGHTRLAGLPRDWWTGRPPSFPRSVCPHSSIAQRWQLHGRSSVATRNAPETSCGCRSLRRPAAPRCDVCAFTIFTPPCSGSDDLVPASAGLGERFSPHRFASFWRFDGGGVTLLVGESASRPRSCARSWAYAGSRH
jgi:shikimate kinase/3-dehydroquinate synthase